MRIKTRYEWVVEELGEIPESERTEEFPEAYEILDTSGYDTLKEALRMLPEKYDLCLTVNEGNEEEGVTFREWAYVKDGKLPDHFGNYPNYKTPQRYHRELEKYGGVL